MSFIYIFIFLYASDGLIIVTESIQSFNSTKKNSEMRIVLQRVSQASVTVDNEVIAKIGKGVVALVGLASTDESFLNNADDRKKLISWASKRILETKLWEDEQSKASWKKSVKDMGYDVILVSQFTLFAQLKGTKTKPDFHRAMSGTIASSFYQEIVESITKDHSHGMFLSALYIYFIIFCPK